MPQKHLLLIRHPETVANSEGRFLGRGDSPYTRTGHAQALALVGEIVHFRPSALWSSPLTRALTIAESAASDLGVPVRADNRLVELDFGEADGLTLEEILGARIPIDLDATDTPVAPGGESREQLQRRVSAALGDIIASGDRVAVVCHSGVVRACLLELLGLKLDHLWSFEVHPAQLARLSLEATSGVLHEYRSA